MSLFSELKRRNVFRAGTAYLVGAWLILQVIDVVLPILGLADWVARLMLLLLTIGFPITLALAWVYELTPQGLQRDADDTRSAATKATAGRKIDFVIIGVLSVAVVFFAIDKFAPRDAPGRSIAVLPFKNMTGESTNEPFTAGIHDDILTHIAKISGIKVISRTSVERLDTNKTVREIGRLLDVATVLEGAVQRSGDRLRVNVQLIEANTDRHLWAQSFDRRLTTQNIFAIQTDIAAAITRTLRATLTPQDEANLSREGTKNFAAYEAYLRGRGLVVRRNVDELKSAIGHLLKATELDPEYALAWVELADAYMLFDTYGTAPFEETMANAESAIDRALALDEQLARAHASKGLSHVKRGQNDEAELSYRRAIELDPNDARAYHWYGNLLVDVAGRSQRAAEAVSLLEKARERDPLYPVISITLGEALENLGQFDQARAMYEKTIDIDPDFPSTYFVLGVWERFVSGRLDESVRWHLREYALDPDRNPNILVYAYLELGDAERAQYWSERSVEIGPNHFWTIASQSYLHWYRGEDQQSLERARRLTQLYPGSGVAALAYVRLGLYEEALRDVLDNHSELDCTDPQVVETNIYESLHLSLALEKTGRAECAGLLLERILELTKHMPRRGLRGYGFIDVEVLARLGRPDEAIATLQSAIDEGRYADWWWELAESPHAVSLRDREDFKNIIAGIRREMAAQLTRLRQQPERNGSLAPEL